MIRRAIITVDTEWTIELDEEKLATHYGENLSDEAIITHFRDAILSGDVRPVDLLSFSRDQATEGGSTGGDVKVEIEEFCEKHGSWMISGLERYCVWCKGDPVRARAREREVAERKKANEQRSRDARG